MTRSTAIPRGRFQQLVMLQKPVYTQSEGGAQEISGYSDVEEVWANVAPLTSAGRYFAQQVYPEVTSRITLDYRDDIRDDWRVVMDDHIFYVRAAPIDVDYAHMILQLECSQEQVGTP